MAVLFDANDQFVRAILDRAKQHREISLADVEAIVEGVLEAKDHICPDDVGDTIDALAEMRIEIDNGLTQEQEDAEFLRCMRNSLARAGAPWRVPDPSRMAPELRAKPTLLLPISSSTRVGHAESRQLTQELGRADPSCRWIIHSSRVG